MGELAFGFFYGPRENIDLWGDLQCVTFRSLQVDVLNGTVDKPQAWLGQRKFTAKPLHVQFTRIKRGSIGKRRAIFC